MSTNNLRKITFIEQFPDTPYTTLSIYKKENEENSEVSELMKCINYMGSSQLYQTIYQNSIEIIIRDYSVQDFNKELWDKHDFIKVYDIFRTRIDNIFKGKPWETLEMVFYGSGQFLSDLQELLKNIEKNEPRMGLGKTGCIDFNEFLEKFKLVKTPETLNNTTLSQDFWNKTNPDIKAVIELDFEYKNNQLVSKNKDKYENNFPPYISKTILNIINSLITQQRVATDSRLERYFPIPEELPKGYQEVKILIKKDQLKNLLK